MTRGQWRSVFGDNLASILKEQGMSQNELAKASGLTSGMISDYINKFATPNVFAIVNIAYVLDVDIDDLVDVGDRIVD